MLYGEIFHASYIRWDFASRKSNYVFWVSYFFKILWQDSEDTQNMLLWSHGKLFYS